MSNLFAYYNNTHTYMYTVYMLCVFNHCLVCLPARVLYKIIDHLSITAAISQGSAKGDSLYVYSLISNHWTIHPNSVQKIQL